MTVYFFQIVSLLIALVLVNGIDAFDSTDDVLGPQPMSDDLEPASGYLRGYHAAPHGYGGGKQGGYRYSGYGAKVYVGHGSKVANRGSYASNIRGGK